MIMIIIAIIIPHVSIPMPRKTGLPGVNNNKSVPEGLGVGPGPGLGLGDGPVVHEKTPLVLVHDCDASEHAPLQFWVPQYVPTAQYG